MIGWERYVIRDSSYLSRRGVDNYSQRTKSNSLGPKLKFELRYKKSGILPFLLPFNMFHNISRLSKTFSFFYPSLKHANVFHLLLFLPIGVIPFDKL